MLNKIVGHKAGRQLVSFDHWVLPDRPLMGASRPTTPFGFLWGLFLPSRRLSRRLLLDVSRPTRDVLHLQRLSMRAGLIPSWCRSPARQAHRPILPCRGPAIAGGQKATDRSRLCPPHPLLPGYLVRHVLSDGQGNLTGRRNRTFGGPIPGYVKPFYVVPLVVDEGD